MLLVISRVKRRQNYAHRLNDSKHWSPTSEGRNASPAATAWDFWLNKCPLKNQENEKKGLYKWAPLICYCWWKKSSFSLILHGCLKTVHSVWKWFKILPIKNMQSWEQHPPTEIWATLLGFTCTRLTWEGMRFFHSCQNDIPFGLMTSKEKHRRSSHTQNSPMKKKSLRYLSSTFFQVVKVSMAKVTGICKSWEDISFSTSQRQKVTSSQDHHVKILDRATLTSKNEWSWNTKLLPFYWLLSRWLWDSLIMFL